MEHDDKPTDGELRVASALWNSFKEPGWGNVITPEIMDVLVANARRSIQALRAAMILRGEKP